MRYLFCVLMVLVMGCNETRQPRPARFTKYHITVYSGGVAVKDLHIELKGDGSMECWFPKGGGFGWRDRYGKQGNVNGVYTLVEE